MNTSVEVPIQYPGVCERCLYYNQAQGVLKALQESEIITSAGITCAPVGTEFSNHVNMDAFAIALKHNELGSPERALIIADVHCIYLFESSGEQGTEPDHT